MNLNQTTQKTLTQSEHNETNIQTSCMFIDLFVDIDSVWIGTRKANTYSISVNGRKKTWEREKNAAVCIWNGARVENSKKKMRIWHNCNVVFWFVIFAFRFVRSPDAIDVRWKSSFFVCHLNDYVFITRSSLTLSFLVLDVFAIGWISVISSFQLANRNSALHVNFSLHRSTA